MTFQARAHIAQDQVLMGRIAACAAGFQEVYADGGHPVAWANNNAWRLAATDGWGEAYAAAESSGSDAPHEVITDAMILPAVTAIMNA